MSSDLITEQAGRQRRANDKIRRHATDMGRPGASAKQAIDDQLLMNEMLRNKAAVDLNRALLDYEQDCKHNVRGS